jgi:phosphatidate cytidylyltransferase
MMMELREQGMPKIDAIDRSDYGWIIPITLMASIWINDTMAYLVGSFIGKTSLSPISPKKTWEGTIGGAILCITLVTLLGHFVFGGEVLDLIVISSIAAIIGTLGDLLESKLKRLAGVKDSGNLMPGHGGFLDRFDSLILATPFVWLFIQAVN